MGRWIGECRDDDAGNVLVRRGRVLRRVSVSEWHGEQAEMRGDAEDHEIIVREPADIDRRDGGIGQGSDKDIADVDFAGEERRMIDARQPLAERHDMLEPRFMGRCSEDRVEMKAVGRSRCALIGALNAFHRGSHIGQRVKVADEDLGARLRHHLRPLIPSADECPDGEAVFTELQDGRQTGLTSGAGDEDLWVRWHGKPPFGC